MSKTNLSLPNLEWQLLSLAGEKIRQVRGVEDFGAGVVRLETNRGGGGREYLTFSRKITKKGEVETILEIERSLTFIRGVESYRIVFLSGQPPAYFYKLDTGSYPEISYRKWKEVKEEGHRFFIVEGFLDTLAVLIPKKDQK